MSALRAWAKDAPAPDVVSTACAREVQHIMHYLPTQFTKLSLSTGKSLPYDAGKYVMCMNAENTRFFLVKMAGAMGKQSMPIEIGFCVPDVCDHAAIIDFVKSDMVKYFVPELPSLQVSNISATSPQLDLTSPHAGGIITAVIVGLLVLLVLVSSTVVLVKKPRPVELPMQASTSWTASGLTPAGHRLLGTPHQAGAWTPAQGLDQPPRQPLLIKAFSLFGESGTLTKLIEIPPYKPTDSLNGMRVLSLTWIILGHTFIMAQGISGYTNPEDIRLTPLNSDVAERRPWIQIIFGSQAGVDTFFFLSGFLLSYLTLKELRQGKMKVLAAIILRYLRLTPSLAVTMLVFYKITVFFGYGPFAVRYQDSINSRCDGSWWSELTYSMNFLDSDKVCMGWSWYLGDDMIFFIISIMILPLYHKSRMLGWASVIGLTGLSFGVTGWLVVRYSLSVYVFDDHYTRFSYWAYSKPYTRIPAYFVGLVAAWLLDEMEKRGITRETRPSSTLVKVSATVGAGLAVFVLLFIVFIPATDFGDGKDTWGPGDNNKNIWSVLYIVVSRPVWSMACALITLLCYYDFLPIINSFMSHPIWTPLARLTYGAYLVHPLVIKLVAARSLQYYTFSGMDIIYRATGNIIFAYSGSVLLWVLVERPCMTIFAPPRKLRNKSDNASERSQPGSGNSTGVPSDQSTIVDNNSGDHFDAEKAEPTTASFQSSSSKDSVEAEC
jgi:peptidoglycan/LPS O-acetylase OafA/YrhL